MTDTTNIIYWGVSDDKKKELSDAITLAVKKGKTPLSEFTRKDWEEAFDREMDNLKQYNGTSENHLDNKTKNLIERLYNNREVSVLDKEGNAIPIRNTPTGWYVLRGKVDGNKELTQTVFNYLKSEFFRKHKRRIRSTDTIVYTDHSFTMFFPITSSYEKFTGMITEELKEAFNEFGYRVYGGPITEVDLQGEYVNGTKRDEIRKIVVKTDRLQTLHEAKITAERAA